MSYEFTIGPKLPALVDSMVASYHREPRIHHIDRAFLPDRGKIVELLERLVELLYPGLHGRQGDLRQPGVGPRSEPAQ